MREVISTSKAPGALAPYSQAIRFGSALITSGQIPLDAQTGVIPDGIKAQTLKALENVKAVVEAAELSVNDIIKTTVFVKDLNQFDEINEVYAQFFSEHKVDNFPARSCVEVARLPKDVSIEIEALATYLK